MVVVSWVDVRIEGKVSIFPSEPSRERVKVSHVMFKSRVINHHPSLPLYFSFALISLTV